MSDTSTSVVDYWLDRLEQSAPFTDDMLAGALEQLKAQRAVSMQLLAGAVLEELAAAAASLSFRPATYQAGKPEARVYQEFDYCGAVPALHPVSILGGWFEHRLQGALMAMTAPPIETGITINDVVCQRYHPGDLGITAHRDHIAYTGLITLVVLGGRGRYFVCDDRHGHGRHELDSRPGRVILMPGPGYAGRRDRPFHLVADISRLRYSVGLRHDSRRTGR